MISDQRGLAWAQALLAKEIHICGEPSAVPLVKSICQSINEDIQIQEYKRLSTLEISQKSLDGDLKKIKKGDCMLPAPKQPIKVAFCKMDVQHCFDSIDQEQVLEIIKEEWYMFINVENLYLETRLQQAKLFNDPNRGVRYNPIPQIKQIAGRAGRIGTEHAVDEVTA
ncbi:P-loop containing nucleoside triphosphate hydrolase protein [Gigaspora margarita]|uniref:P-loop containing nucleoside triphosphate hydrolase protein n=1 Tax=Gigaspora margarita TaxID=4874 RepID=A0A8H3X6K2_GIGMA|nr:P-loop containing nucleoside triphosphate hydrolase protein [Gigaspora margarita]